jgi:NAD(P)-dependent dehydrogenase (short-subunit alcohol dehydrogenase family)
MEGMQNKVIAITGASAGIGQELAIQLARRGATLVLAARTEAALEQTRAECAAIGADVTCVTTDVSRVDDCRRLVQSAIDCFGRLDVMLNNAGISMYAPFERITDLGVFARMMEVNYLGAVYCTHFALPHLKKSHGLVVAVSSLQGKTGFPNSTATPPASTPCRGSSTRCGPSSLKAALTCSWFLRVQWRLQFTHEGWLAMA